MNIISKNTTVEFICLVLCFRGWRKLNRQNGRRTEEAKALGAQLKIGCFGRTFTLPITATSFPRSFILSS